MALLVPNRGEQSVLELVTNKRAVENLTLKLYVNNVTPAEGDTAASYTEMSTQGYVAKALTGASWTVTGGAPSDATAALQTWTFDGTGGLTQVYGYFLVGTTSALLYWAERFSDGPYPIANNGDKINLTPKITAD